MALQIVCQKRDGPAQYVELNPGKQVRIRIKSSSAGEGTVCFTATESDCSFRYEGGAAPIVDGRERTAGTLAPDGELVIGKMTFRIVEPERSDETVPYRNPGVPSPTVTLADGVAEATVDEDRRSDSQDLDPQIAQHQRTSELPDAALVAGGEALEQEETVDMPGGAEASIRRAKGEQEETADLSGAVPGESEGERRRRRLSASQDSQVSLSTGRSNKGLLDKMARMFRRNDSRVTRLRQLLENRDELYKELGRTVLSPDGGIGLPVDAVPAWLRGEEADVSLGRIDRVRLEEYAKINKLVNDLNTEIHALRVEMGMDDAADRMPGETVLRTERQEAEDRAFSASDVVFTEDLGEAQAPQASQAETEPTIRPPGTRVEQDGRTETAEAPEGTADDEGRSERGAEGKGGHRRRGHRRRRRR